MSAMFERFDEAELLALIEDELDSDRAEALRTRLRDTDPRALEAVERMRADREILSSLDTPEVPGELLGELEPMIARPMLMPPPGQLRRRYQSERRRRRLPLAAGLGLTALAGVWGAIWLVSQLPSIGASLSEIVGREAAEEPPGSSTGSVAVGTERTAPNGARPGGGVAHDEQAEAVTLAKAAEAGPSSTKPGVAETAGFRLVIRGQDAAAAEALLARALATLETRGALVRNLTIDEGQTLTESWQRERASRGVDPDRTVAQGPRGGPPMRRVREQNRRLPAPLPDAAGPETPVATQLVGPREMAPSFERQLEFTRQGCSYTIAVRLADLDSVLAHLQLVEGNATTLESGNGGRRWMDDYATVRRELQRLRAAGDDVIVYVPVAVLSAP